jgi:hypothetical protein
MFSIEQHGKVFKVFRIIPGMNDGKNRKLLGKFKNSTDAEIFVNSLLMAG